MAQRKFYKKSDFKKGDFILYQYMKNEYIKGEIVELRDQKALIEIAIPTKKISELKTEQFEVDYFDLIPFAKAFVGFGTEQKSKEDDV